MPTDSSPPSNTDLPDAPPSPKELRPTRVYIAELIGLPFFWLAPIALVLFGGGMYGDIEKLREKYNLEFPDIRYLWYISPFALSYFATFLYRRQRAFAIASNLGLKPSQLTVYKERLNVPKGYVIRFSAIFQLLAFFSIAFLPKPLGTKLVLVDLAVIALTPLAALYDARQLTNVDHIDWKYVKYILAILSVVPFGVYPYIIQRDMHVNHAALIEAWGVDSHPENKDPSLGEKLTDTLFETVY